MALIIEDGTGKPDADSYITVADTDTYITNYYGAADPWLLLDEPTKEVWLRRGAKYIDDHYFYRWKGLQAVDNQALQWPRTDVVRQSGYSVNSNEVPREIPTAQAEAAKRFSIDSEAPQPDLERGGAVKREKVDVIEIEYMDGAPAGTKYTQVDDLVKDLVDEPATVRRA